MASKRRTPKAKQLVADADTSKRQLQQQMERTRESLAETVGEIRETIGQEVSLIKDTAAGVLDYRKEFQKEPLVWSLGALSAGFALGYTIGYAHKNSKGRRQAPLMAFADSMVDEISSLGSGLVVPALDSKIKELFGFELSDVLEEIGGAKKPAKRKKARRKTTVKESAKSSVKRVKKTTKPVRKKKNKKASAAGG